MWRRTKGEGASRGLTLLTCSSGIQKIECIVVRSAKRLYKEMRRVSGIRGVVLMQDVHRTVADSACYRDHMIFGRQGHGHVIFRQANSNNFKDVDLAPVTTT